MRNKYHTRITYIIIIKQTREHIAAMVLYGTVEDFAHRNYNTHKQQTVLDASRKEFSYAIQKPVKIL